jgi:hypothetical protein
VYRRVADDPRFERVYRNDAALATWLRLLILADGMWPANAPIPRACKDAPLRLLEEVGLIEIVGDDYRIHGMNAERTRTAQHAARASKVRWSGNAESNAPSIPASNAQTMPLNATHLNSTQRKVIPAEEKPFVMLSEDEKAARLQALEDETARKAGWKVTVAE